MPRHRCNVFWEIQTYGKLGGVRHREVYRVTECWGSGGNQDFCTASKRHSPERTRYNAGLSLRNSYTHASNQNGCITVFIGEPKPNLMASEADSHPLTYSLIVEREQRLTRICVCFLRTCRPGGDPCRPLPHCTIREEEQKENKNDL